MKASKRALFFVIVFCLSCSLIVQAADTNVVIQNISYDLESDSSGDFIVISWVAEFNAPTAILNGTGFLINPSGEIAGTATLSKDFSVTRSKTTVTGDGVVSASFFQATIPYSGSKSLLTPNLNTLVVTVEATGRNQQDTVTGKGILRVNLDSVRRAFSDRKTKDNNGTTITELNQGIKTLTEQRDFFRQFASDYPRKVAWRAEAFNNVVVIKGNSTYSAKVQAVATAADGSEVKSAITTMPAIDQASVPITGLKQNTTYTIKLVEIRDSTIAPAPPSIAFDPAGTQITTSDLPEPRVEFASAPINVRNALLRLPLRVRASAQLKVSISEARPGASIERLVQSITLDTKLVQAKIFTEHQIELPFEAKEGVAYLVKVQPLAPFQVANPNQEVENTFTGLRALLADTVNIKFALDGIEFSAKSADKIKLEVVAKVADNPTFSWTGEASSEPKFTVKYASLPVSALEGLPLIIGLKADDSSGREQIQRITLRVVSPQQNNNKVKEELVKFGSEIAKLPNGNPNEGQKISIKSIAATGLGILLKALFPAMP